MLKKKMQNVLVVSAVVLAVAVGSVLFLKNLGGKGGRTLFLAANELSDEPESSDDDGSSGSNPDKLEHSENKAPASPNSNNPNSTLPSLAFAFKDGLGVSYEAKLSSSKPLMPAAQDEVNDPAELEPENDTEITTEYIAENEEIPFETIYEETDALALGEKEVAQVGVNGICRVVYQQTFTNGILTAANEFSREIIQEAISHIILVGTAGVVSEEEEYIWPNPLGASADNRGSGGTSYLGFASPGFSNAAAQNYGIIAGLLNYNGTQSYGSFSDNGDGTITVDGVTLPVASGPSSYYTTFYDGYECAKVTDFQYAVTAPNGLPCNNTASGLLAARGVISTAQSGGLPFGTVLFVEGYGLGVVGDRGSFSANTLDLCLDAGEIEAGVSVTSSNRSVYIISIP